jgi:hypothetical protein
MVPAAQDNVPRRARAPRGRLAAAPALLLLFLAVLSLAACNKSSAPPSAAAPANPSPRGGAPAAPGGPASAAMRIPLQFTGGHDTDPRDHGRPVALVAGGLGVSPDAFRAAFSHVTPAPAGAAPDPAQVQRNKAALLGALGKYGVTNELLDKVSDYYRYDPAQGRLWPTTQAAGFAEVKDGRVVMAVLTNPGAGYTTPPKVAIPGFPDVGLRADLAFGPDLSKNGSVSGLTRQ